MSAQILVLTFGSLLILLGLVGGGFTVKGVALPKIQNVARTFSVIVGLILIVFGSFGFDEKAAEIPAKVVAVATAATTAPPEIIRVPVAPVQVWKQPVVNNAAAPGVKPPDPEDHGSRIMFIEATYGKNGGVPEGNATDYVSAKCIGHTECDYIIEGLGDPAPNVPKDFIVKWTCGEGPLKIAIVAGEALGKSVHLQCP